MPFETYASLLNLKIIIPSSKSNYVAVEKSYWIASFFPRLAQIDLDQDWYLHRYPDVAAAIGSDMVADARQHYCESGYFEHRMPYRIDVDEAWYAAQYADVQAAVAKQVFGSAQEHFEAIGYREGRHPYAGFALRERADKLIPLRVQSRPVTAMSA